MLLKGKSHIYLHSNSSRNVGKFEESEIPETMGKWCISTCVIAMWIFWTMMTNHSNVGAISIMGSFFRHTKLCDVVSTYETSITEHFSLANSCSLLG